MFQIHGIKYRAENELDREAMNTVAYRISQALRKILIQLSPKKYRSDSTNGNVLVEIDKTYYRPTEVDNLIGDASKANVELGWKPTHSRR